MLYVVFLANLLFTASQVATFNLVKICKLKEIKQIMTT